ncbi:hypothetical protein Ancab_000745 [Ancistrocladus abbreviatus]
MSRLLLSNTRACCPPNFSFSQTVRSYPNCHDFPSSHASFWHKTSPILSPFSSSPVLLNCRNRFSDDNPLSTNSAYAVLGVEPHCSPAELKSAFRAKVKGISS